MALATGFAHAAGPGGALAPAGIADVLSRSGASAVVLDASLDAARLDGLVRELDGGLPVLALESPCPASLASSAQLASPDKDEAQVALKAAEETCRRAAALGARFVVLRLGELRSLARDWSYARNKFLRGDLDEALARSMAEAREQAGERELDVARRALDKLCRSAEQAGVTLTLRNDRRYIALPTPRELDQLLADFTGAPVAPMCDVAAAHLPDVMGFFPMSLTLAAFGPKAPLLYMGDACGPVAGLAPGMGVLDLAGIRKTLPKDAAVAFSPWSGLTPDECVAAVPALQAGPLRRGG